MGKIFCIIIFILCSNFALSKSYEDSLIVSDSTKKDTIHEKGFTVNIAALTLIDFTKNRDEQFGVGFYRNLNKGLFFSAGITFMMKRADYIPLLPVHVNDTFKKQKIEYYTNSKFFTFQAGINIFNPDSKFTIYTGVDLFYSFFRDTKTLTEKSTIYFTSTSMYPYTVVNEETLVKSQRKNTVTGICFKIGVTSKLNEKLRISLGIEPYLGKVFIASTDYSFVSGATTHSKLSQNFGFLPALLNNVSLLIKLN